MSCLPPADLVTSPLAPFSRATISSEPFKDSNPCARYFTRGQEPTFGIASVAVAAANGRKSERDGTVFRASAPRHESLWRSPRKLDGATRLKISESLTIFSLTKLLDGAARKFSVARSARSARRSIRASIFLAPFPPGAASLTVDDASL